MSANDLKVAPTPPGEPPDKALGLALARRIERTRGLVLQARRKVKRSEAKGRKRARKQLDRFEELLADVEQDAISNGVTEPFAEDSARILLDGEEYLDVLVDRKGELKKRHLRRVRKQVRAVRRRMEALLSSRPSPTPTLVEHDAEDTSEEPHSSSPVTPPSAHPSEENHPS